MKPLPLEEDLVAPVLQVRALRVPWVVAPRGTIHVDVDANPQTLSRLLIAPRTFRPLRS